MKTKSKVLVGLMAISLLGGVGGALAISRNGATLTGNQGNYDQAIYLNWTTDSQSLLLDDMTNLVAATPQYRFLTVSPKSTKSVTGTVTLTFTLAAGGESTHMEGLSVAVYETTTASDSTLTSGATLKQTLTKTNLSGTASFTVSSDTQAHETVKYYTMMVLWDGSNDSSHPTYALGASMTISQGFAA